MLSKLMLVVVCASVASADIVDDEEDAQRAFLRAVDARLHYTMMHHGKNVF